MFILWRSAVAAGVGDVPPFKFVWCATALARLEAGVELRRVALEPCNPSQQGAGTGKVEIALDRAAHVVQRNRSSASTDLSLDHQEELKHRRVDPLELLAIDDPIAAEGELTRRDLAKRRRDEQIDRAV